VVFDDNGEILPDRSIIQPRQTDHKIHAELVGAGAN
jgi:hypothetical protein